MRNDPSALRNATILGTILQLAMVISGHFVPAIALMFGILGMLISAFVGGVYGRRAMGSRSDAAGGGAIAGGVCALIGIIVSFALGDVTALILVVGTISSAVTGALGGLVGRAMRGRREVPAMA